jgi:hypothetical protein
MKTLKFTTIVSVFAGLLLVGCVDNPLSDLTPADDSATLQEQALAKAPQMVPIKGDATFAADMTVPILLCLDVDTGEVGDVFFGRFTGEAIYSHLGATTFVGVSDDCWVDSGTLAVTGRGTLTAANGDELWILWGLTGQAGINEGVAEWSFYEYAGDYPVEFTGGTGRFEGAYGHIGGAGTFDYSDLTGTWWSEGVISSVGSTK